MKKAWKKFVSKITSFDFWVDMMFLTFVTVALISFKVLVIWVIVQSISGSGCAE